MKILMVHNYYQSRTPSGEDIVFENEVALLRNKGHSVITYTRHNDEIKLLKGKDRIRGAFQSIWSHQDYHHIKTIIKRERVDVAYFLNVWYRISPSAFYACKEENIPVSINIQNYRLFCVNALFYRSGRICEDCLGRLPWRGVVHRCFNGSLSRSLLIASTIVLHRIRKTWTEMVDAYITPSHFSRDKFIKGGIPPEKVFVKPNFLPYNPEPSPVHENYAIFVGRLSHEKGVYTLLRAWKEINIPLLIAGDGPLKDLVLKNPPERIRFLGKIPHKDVLKYLSRAMFMVVPSEWYEGFPMVLIEAMAHGVPVIASRIGSIAEIVLDGKTGLLFTPGDHNDLISRVQWLINNPDELNKFRENARKQFLLNYTSEAVYQTLMNIFQKIITENNTSDK